jgi:hypothetical protein
VWPGPSWARLARSAGRPGANWRIRFDDDLKDAWDLDPFIRRRPTPVARIVFLQRTEDANLEWRSIPKEEAIGRLGDHVGWLLDLADGPKRIFPWAVSLASAAPCFLLAVPSGPGWAERAIERLDLG